MERPTAKLFYWGGILGYSWEIKGKGWVKGRSVSRETLTVLKQPLGMTKALIRIVRQYKIALPGLSKAFPNNSTLRRPHHRSRSPHLHIRLPRPPELRS